MEDYRPKQQGLYHPSFEKDACGIGCVCQIKGIKSHQIIEDALEILKNMTHRGGVGSEVDSGDGAGILFGLPHEFFKKACPSCGILLPEEGEYGVGMLFLSPDKEKQEKSLALLFQIIEEEGQQVLGVRPVPVYPKTIGKTAGNSQPYICQVFVGKADTVKNQQEFERKLYVIGKKAERAIRKNGKDADPYFYFASFSSRTIVYKGMLTPQQVQKFYLDLQDLDVKSALAMVHSRFSTNTFPSWERAHPNRYLIHNGEINTIHSNVNWVKAKEPTMRSDTFGEDLEKVFPIINEDGSDSARLDNYIQFLTLQGMPLIKAMAVCIPEPWEKDEWMKKERHDFYEYYHCMAEPWDGPAAIGFTDGEVLGALLDRNGLRPARYCITKDDRLILSSESGTLNIPPQEVIKRDLLRPGEILAVDTKKGKLLTEKDIEDILFADKPYGQWVRHITPIGQLTAVAENTNKETLPLVQRQKLFGYTWEDIHLLLKDILKQGEDPVSAMGTDIPLAVLSQRPQLLYNYFKQLFAQVTNPPIDAIREKVVTSTRMLLGSTPNILEESDAHCHKIALDTPILTNEELATVQSGGFLQAVTLPIFFQRGQKDGLQKSLALVCKKAEDAIKKGSKVLILSDRGADETHVPIPGLLAVAGLHNHLIQKGVRMQASIVLESGEPREVHHFVTLLGYGCSAINPYMAYENIGQLTDSGLVAMTKEEGVATYVAAMTKGIVKVMSKMGVSTLQSYHGAQIFEALGIEQHVVDTFFTGTVSRIGGVGLSDIERETLLRHENAFERMQEEELDTGGDYKWRKDGEYHLYNPKSIALLQQACKTGDYDLYKAFAADMNTETERFCHIRGLLQMNLSDKPIAISEVEPVESIVKRFKTGAMSYGSISKEAHECMAIAMNRLGAKSNTGEGGETPDRFVRNPGEDSKRSAIKQVASGRFGVNIEYLRNADEIQIKMAQGAKPGEGGHLPGQKVYPWIAKARNSTPGVELISPPPHHDIYSIEDLAQLIHDLKNANPNARISVKLVSEAGVGTIAVGVAKGLADVIVISGYDGGTGAAPRTSIRHTGLPWELGVAETHQTLLMNNLRNRVTIETDGKLLTGRDVAVAALLGAEEFGFATGPLVAMGCVMMRVCNLDVCPVGVATQNPELRKNFKGKPEYIENFMKFIAQDLREWMAQLGFKTINEMIGHVEKLSPKKPKDHWKAKTVDLLPVLYQPKICNNDFERYFNQPQNHMLDETMDADTFVPLCQPALHEGKKVEASVSIRNINRCTGAYLSGQIAQLKGLEGLEEDAVKLQFYGSAGQSFGAFLAKGVTLTLHGDANDYVGKGLSGGKIIIKTPPDAGFLSAENIVAGNVCFYGAVTGEGYINGMAGERFAVRNSGAKVVVEGIGSHGLEYMTGGVVAVLGKVGRNFAAGMSGGYAFVYNPQDTLKDNINPGPVLMEALSTEDQAQLKEMITRHFDYTNSRKAKRILDSWEEEKQAFVKVIPRGYKAITGLIRQYKNAGCPEEEAHLKAFEEFVGKAGE